MLFGSLNCFCCHRHKLKEPVPKSYTPLDVASSEIRTLTLLPGSNADPVRSELEVVSLNNNPQYEALSYVWGEVTDQKRISVDNQDFHVTDNLEASLRALRDPVKPRCLWIDAICINQDDIPEKNTQVPLMGKVYKQATSVLVWLGDSTANIDLVMPWIPTLGEDHHPSRGDSMQTMSRVEKIRILCGLLEIVTRPYWKRKWTFQEFHLPESDPVTICGKHAFNVKDVANMINRFEIKFSDVTEDDMKDPQVNASKDCFSADNVARIMSGRQMLQSRKFQSMPFGICIGMTGGRACGNPRDTIYALYGLYPKVQAELPPDYNKSVERVMHETTAYILNQELDSFQYIVPSFSFYPNRKQGLDIPSWVLDLAYQTDESEKHYQYRMMSKIDTDITRTPLRVSEDLKTLHVYGRSLGSFRVILHFEDDVQLLAKQIHDLLGLEEESNGSLSADELERYHRLTRAVVPASSRLVVFGMKNARKTLNDPVSAINSPTLDSLYQALKGRALIETTSTGRYGVTVGDVGEDDIVVVSRNFGVPVILRPDPKVDEYASGIAPVEGGEGDEDVALIQHQAEVPCIPRTATAEGCGLGNVSHKHTYRLWGIANIEGVVGFDVKVPELVAQINELAVEEFIVR